MTAPAPSPEDVDRFGGDTAHCPECGQTVWDQAEVCPACGAWFPEGPSSRPPMDRMINARVVTLVLVVAGAAFFITWLLSILSHEPAP